MQLENALHYSRRTARQAYILQQSVSPHLEAARDNAPSHNQETSGLFDMESPPSAIGLVTTSIRGAHSEMAAAIISHASYDLMLCLNESVATTIFIDSDARDRHCRRQIGLGHVILSHFSLLEFSQQAKIRLCSREERPEQSKSAL